MYTLRDKIADYIGDMNAEIIMHIIENHIEWTNPTSCRFGHVFSDCGAYEITSTNAVYYNGDMIASRHTLDEAKQAAQTHKEGRG